MNKLASSSKDEDVDDFVRMWILLIFACFLFPSSGYGFPRVLTPYVDDLDKLGSYSWGSTIRDYLLQNVQKYGKYLGNEKMGGYVKGCTAALCVSILSLFLFISFKHVF